MPRFEPFRALRYAPDRLDRVTAPPYDVLSDEQRSDLASRDSDNIVHVDVPLESEGPLRYERAATLLEEWRKSGVLQLDSQPSLTVYRMSFRDEAGRLRNTVGVIGALEVVDENSGGVLPHERTTPKAKTDRLDLTKATGCNLSPVWGLTLAIGLTDLLAAPGHPIGSVEADGVRHSFERIDASDRIYDICSRISEQDVVIADGHHRYAISRQYRDELRAANDVLAPAADLTMSYVAELVEDQLSVAAIHRLYRLQDFTAFEQALSEYFEITSCPPVTPDITKWMLQSGSLVLISRDGKAISLVPRRESFRGIRDLDGSRLEYALRDCPHEITYQHGVENVVGSLRSGSFDAGILIRPATVDEIRRTAHDHDLMPPKSTFFTPKILTGVAIRPLRP